MYTLTVCRLDMALCPPVRVYRGGKIEIGPVGPYGLEGSSLALYSLEAAEALGQALLTAVQAERDYLARHEPQGREMGTARA